MARLDSLLLLCMQVGVKDDDEKDDEEHDGGLGSYFFRRSSARTAPFCVAITTATFPESRFFHACFFRAMLWVRAAAGGLRCVMWPRGQGQ